MSDHRQEQRRVFISETGWQTATVAPLAGDASNRRYLRLTGPSRTAVLMDAPPERGEDVRPFLAMTGWLREHGFSAPEILGADPATGFLLLEDLGDDLFARWLRDAPVEEPALYSEAVRLLAVLADRSPPEAQPLSPYDAAVLENEALLVVDWWIRDASADLRAEFRELLRSACQPVAEDRAVVVLRDYHAENLLWLPGREGLSRVGLLDYQDALTGHPAYDIVSLLEDARRDTSAELREAMLDLYLAERPGQGPEEFRAAYATLGAQRSLKIIGIFARLALRDGKPRYVDLIPRVWGHLMRDLAHPGLGALAGWVTRHVPPPDGPALTRIARMAGAAG